MKNTVLISLIIRLAGFALFVKIFDFFGSYFASIYLTASMSILDETYDMADAFDKLFISGASMAFIHLFLALVLILKSDWIAERLIKTDSEITIDLTAKSLMRMIIAIIGVIYCSKTLYQVPVQIDSIISLINWEGEVTYIHIVADLIGYFIRALIGVVFILRSEQLSKLAMRRSKSQQHKKQGEVELRESH